MTDLNANLQPLLAEMKQIGVTVVRWNRSVGGEMIQHTMEIE